MNTEMDENNESDIKIEIQKTLSSINEITSKIKNELDIINNLLKKDGELHTAVSDANETLTTVAENMDLNVEDILSNKENENKMQFNLRNILPAAAIQEKISACLDNM